MFERPVIAEATRADAAPTDDAPARVPHYRRWSLAIVAVLLAVVTLLSRRMIARLDYSDPDDRMRLLEVRDWLGGQAFRDVTQYRIDPPWGGPMHWSRLVDAPLAAVELLLRPLLGAAQAELAAAILVPLATLAIIMLVAGAIARRLAGDRAGLVATALLPMAFATTAQARPMRVDHHGWEIAWALLALRAAIDARPLRGGVLAGLFAAIALQISLETLPFAVALGAVIGLRWTLTGTRDEAARLTGFALALALTESSLFLLLHAPMQWASGVCDAVSPPHLAAILLASGGVAAAVRLAPATPAGRAILLALAGGAAGAAFRLIPPGCGLDAFSALEPFVHDHWYERINEGLPVWRGPWDVAAITVGYVPVAILCGLLALRAAPRARRLDWMSWILMAAATGLVGVLVLRAGSLASAVAVPGGAWAICRLVARAQRSPRAPVRVFGTVGAALLLMPWAAMLLLVPVADALRADQGGARSDDGGAHAPEHACTRRAAVLPLAALPPGLAFSGLDIAPSLLLDTPLTVVATGHHRQHARMEQVLRGFIGDDAAAHRTIGRLHAAYVVACPGSGEWQSYRAAGPDGFAAHLAAGHAPGWLRPIALPRGSSLRAWAVTG